jgi:hypothetical protein
MATWPREHGGSVAVATPVAIDGGAGAWRSGASEGGWGSGADRGGG